MAATETISLPAAPSQRPRQRPDLSGEAPRRWKWTSDDLIRMGEAGLLPREGRFELLDGDVYELMPPNPLHAFIVGLIRTLLHPVVSCRGAHIREEKPLRLRDGYDPQPDVAVVRGREHDYRDRFPGPGDVLLVIEVAETSLEHDRTMKLPAYAEAGIPECWIVNLPEKAIEVYRDPEGGAYRVGRIARSGETVEPLCAPESALSVAELLGEAQPEAGSSLSLSAQQT
jgi:Uma2 family endonuclease